MIKSKFIKLLKQPSTWRGLINVLTGFSIFIDPHYIAIILPIGMFLSGIIGMFLDDIPNPTDTEEIFDVMAHTINPNISLNK